MAATRISEALVEKLGLDMSEFEARLREVGKEGRAAKEAFEAGAPESKMTQTREDDR